MRRDPLGWKTSRVGQLRRLGLGLELVNDPDWLVCDEVTSGLDPRSEDQILDVLRGLATERGKSFICIIHNLAKLRSFDRITVLGQGAMLFQGSYPEFLAHFKIEDPLQLYERLNEKVLDLWKAQWVEAQQWNARAKAAAEPHGMGAEADWKSALLWHRAAGRRRGRCCGGGGSFFGATGAI
ncbi:MAG: hypothetical protein H2171_13920 [Opitutus sp.]|nr:hypothetical protein [Opitutus sp.]